MKWLPLLLLLAGCFNLERLERAERKLQQMDDRAVVCKHEIDDVRGDLAAARGPLPDLLRDTLEIVGIAFFTWLTGGAVARRFRSRKP